MDLHIICKLYARYESCKECYYTNSHRCQSNYRVNVATIVHGALASLCSYCCKHWPHFTCKPGLKASKLVCIVSQPPTPKSNPSRITNSQAFLISKVSLHILRSSQKSHTQMHTTITHRPPTPYPNPTQILAYPTNISKIFNDARQAEISLP